MNKFSRLDKVIYKGDIAYIHHISEEGFIHTAWLYGTPINKKHPSYSHEPVALNKLEKVDRLTNYSTFAQGSIGIDHLLECDVRELLEVCKEYNVDLTMADITCYYKRLWFVLDGQLMTVQTTTEAIEKGVLKIYNDIVEYIYENSR